MPDESPYYQRTAQDTLESLGAQPGGLSSGEAKERLNRFGPNSLPERKRKSLFLVFLEQFRGLMAALLGTAAGISLFTGNREGALVILAVLILHAALGTAQRVKAESSLASLQALSAPQSKILRDSRRMSIPARELVPGDILELEAGDMVGADARLLESWCLKTGERTLTGESEPVEKHAAAITREVPLAERRNMVFSGCLVTYGRGTAVVTATGKNTELGRIAALMDRGPARPTPLQAGLDAVGARLAVWVLAICASVFALGLFRGRTIPDALLFSVALAAASIPEALGSIAAVVQAAIAAKMAKRSAVVQNLNAVETLGCVRVICSDKTGPLTRNRMTPQSVWTGGRHFPAHALEPDNPPCRELLRCALLANDAAAGHGTVVGDPAETALIMLGDSLGIDETQFRAQYPRLAGLAFDSERELMSTLHDVRGCPTLYTKGAADVLLARCTHILTPQGRKPLAQAQRESVLAQNAAWSGQGLRVLAFAFRQLPQPERLSWEDEQSLTFLGLVSMMDPPRPEAAQAVEQARQGGVRTIMMTGDHRITAAAIARQLGLSRDGEETLTGEELDKLDNAALDRRLEHISVYARISPEHKIRIVEAWQRKGAVVAMTGDGVNDAPALRAADIGIAMGSTGTQVARDAADIILADDSFAAIVEAVASGRGVYANLKNAVGFLLSGNLAGLMSVFVTSLLGLPMPFAPVQLLFMNLLTDSLPAIAIGMEPPGAQVLRQAPRDPDAPMLDAPFLARVMGYGGALAAATLGGYALGLSAQGAQRAMTLAFVTLTLGRLFHGFNCRGTDGILRLGLRSNPCALGAFALGAGALALTLFVPGLARLFELSPVPAGQLGAAAGLAALPTAVIQGWRELRCQVRRDRVREKSAKSGMAHS